MSQARCAGARACHGDRCTPTPKARRLLKYALALEYISIYLHAIELLAPVNTATSFSLIYRPEKTCETVQKSREANAMINAPSRS